MIMEIYDILKLKIVEPLYTAQFLEINPWPT
jgi:hypothetical protein